MVSAKNSLFAMLAVSGIITLQGCSTQSDEDIRDNCLTEAAKAPTEEGVRTADGACWSRYVTAIGKKTSQPKQVASQSGVSTAKIKEICHLYWDGAEWKLGKTNKKEFGQLEWSYYGVPVMNMGIPKAMVQQFRISSKVVSGAPVPHNMLPDEILDKLQTSESIKLNGNEIMMNSSFNKFLDKYFTQVLSICELEHVK